jgi:hypothetical protein
MYKGGEGEEEIQKIRDVITILHKYSTIYIAIGAKYHPDNYPLRTNTGMYQLVPNFIFEQAVSNQETCSKTLIIIIDKFKPDELQINNKLIKNMLDGIESNVNYIIVNHYFDEIIKDKIADLVSALTEQKIYIVDYVYFFSEMPTIAEQGTLKNIILLLKILVDIFKNKYGVEKPCQLPLDKNVFKWLGPIEPNYIVSVEKYQIISNALSYDIKKRNFERWKSDLLKITPTY